MENENLVSIIIPSFNQGNFLEETILSILNQDYPYIELIVIDGGSTDNSIEVIKKYEQNISYWVSEPDQGQADAINKGWLKATGDILGWLNSDDLLCSDAVSLAVDYFIQHPDVGFVYGDIYHIDEENNKLGVSNIGKFNLREMIRKAGYIPQQGNFLRRCVLDKAGLLDTNLHFQIDLDYWIRAGLVCKFGYIHKPLACFRRYDTTKTSSRSDLAAVDILYIYNKLFSRDELPLEIKNIENEAESNAHLYSAWAWFLYGDIKKTRNEMKFAIRIYQKIMFTKKFIKLSIHIILVKIIGYDMYKTIKKSYKKNKFSL